MDVTNVMEATHCVRLGFYTLPNIPTGDLSPARTRVAGDRGLFFILCPRPPSSTGLLPTERLRRRHHLTPYGVSPTLCGSATINQDDGVKPHGNG